MDGTVDLIGLTEAWPGWEVWAERSLTPPGSPGGAPAAMDT
jgi:hypothetical protein